MDSLREVLLEDLLGRDPILLNWKKIIGSVENKTVLITGAGGSIGSELCRQVARLRPTRLILVEHSEYHLYLMERELMEVFPTLKFSIYLCSVTHDVMMNTILVKESPQLIFHAAAYKQVPMLESQVVVAVKNNVLGTDVLAKNAVAAGVEKFIFISTDKAVNPVSVMGATKRLAELVCEAYNRKMSTQFMTVRFGNVLGSAGSVVPLFREQIAKGGPITVTHPDIARYFMTIPEACQLIMQASILGLGGEVFVLDMGKPIKIRDLAEQMIRSTGKKVNDDIKIVYTGLRPGERLHETLFHQQENLIRTKHEKILLAKQASLDWDHLSNTMIQLRKACERCDESRLKLLLVETYEKRNFSIN